MGIFLLKKKNYEILFVDLNIFVDYINLVWGMGFIWGV